MTETPKHSGHYDDVDLGPNQLQTFVLAQRFTTPTGTSTRITKVRAKSRAEAIAKVARNLTLGERPLTVKSSG